MVRRAHLDWGVPVDQRAGLVHARAGDEHLAGEDDGLRAGARRREAAGHEELVDAHLRHAATIARLRDGRVRVEGARQHGEALGDAGARAQDALVADRHDVPLAHGADAAPARAPPA